MPNSIFNKKYVDTILEPFLGKVLRMLTESTDKSFKIPFCLEAGMETGINIEFTDLGISYVLKDNYYIKEQLLSTHISAIQETGIYAHEFDKLYKGEKPKDVVSPYVVELIENYLTANFKPQIAITYYPMITSLEVSEHYFILNGVKFIVTK